MAKEVINTGTTPNDGTGDTLRNAFIKVNENFSELYDGLQLTETEWNVPDIGTVPISTGSFLNILSLFNNTTHKNTANSDVYDQLNIVSNGIKTTYRGCKITHQIRVALNVEVGEAKSYQMQIRRASDNSIVYRTPVFRNADDSIQTIEMTTRTLSATDPFVTDGFYIAFVNNSGVNVNLIGSISLLIINHYQKTQPQ